MYMRAVTYRIVYVGIVSVGILLTAAARRAPAPPPPPPAAAPRGATTAQLPIVTLPTVEVRPLAARVAGAKAPVVSKGVAAERLDDTATAPHAVTAPTLRLDMPYYSFGKVLPRVGKE